MWEPGKSRERERERGGRRRERRGCIYDRIA